MAGHQSLRREAGILHRDISVNNVLVNEKVNSTWPGFLIDLDFAIREKRLKNSGALDKTGTKVFMAVGALLGETHSFMHDLESFFWVLFWLCIHYTGPKGATRVVPEFDEWNFQTLEALATMKVGTISDEGLFLTKMVKFATPYFESLIPWINKLRTKVFPNDKKWKVEDETLYEQMGEVLREAMMDPEVRAE
jgi:Fungal protein kinase